MSDLDNTLEAAGIDPDTYCGVLYGWTITRSGHSSMGRGDWLTKEAALSSLQEELCGLTDREVDRITVCQVYSCHWQNGQGCSLESWNVDSVIGVVVYD